jgi:NADH:ubiquinone oxidoreductase subunit 2 (subunit N)
MIEIENINEYIAALSYDRTFKFQIDDNIVETFFFAFQKNGAFENLQISILILSQVLAEAVAIVGVLALLVNVGSKYNSASATVLWYNNKAISTCISWSIFIVLSAQIFFMFLIPSSAAILVSDSYSINFQTQIAKLLLVLISIYLQHFSAYVRQGDMRSNISEFFILINVCIILSFILVSCESFATLLLALEGLSLSLYIFAALDRTQGGVMASVKYFVFGT